MIEEQQENGTKGRAEWRKAKHDRTDEWVAASSKPIDNVKQRLARIRRLL